MDEPSASDRIKRLPNFGRKAAPSAGRPAVAPSKPTPVDQNTLPLFPAPSRAITTSIRDHLFPFVAGDLPWTGRSSLDLHAVGYTTFMAVWVRGSWDDSPWSQGGQRSSDDV
jgi:hypothetical protein